MNPKDPKFDPLFDSLFNTPKPDANQRYQIWKHAFNYPIKLDSDIDLAEIANKYELNGWAVMNILRYVLISKIENGKESITNAILTKGIERELAKPK